MARLRVLGYSNPDTLAYQSKVGPVPWLQPYTDDKIKELARGGVSSLVVVRTSRAPEPPVAPFFSATAAPLFSCQVPISFVSEHIETLEEIDIEYRELAEEAGITHWERVPALGVEEDFIEDLASAVVEALPRMEQRPLQEIDEGRPVSLRVVNDLVSLRSKEEIGAEYGPVRVRNYRRVGFTPKAEVINGRIAMAAITVASLSSYLQGDLWDVIYNGRIPFEWF